MEGPCRVAFCCFTWSGVPVSALEDISKAGCRGAGDVGDVGDVDDVDDVGDVDEAETIERERCSTAGMACDLSIGLPARDDGFSCFLNPCLASPRP